MQWSNNAQALPNAMHDAALLAGFCADKSDGRCRLWAISKGVEQSFNFVARSVLIVLQSCAALRAHVLARVRPKNSL